MRRVLSLFLVLMFLLASCQSTQANEPGAEEYAVYAAVLQQRYVPQGAERFVLQDQTFPTIGEDPSPSLFLRLKADVPAVTDDLLVDFSKANDQLYPLKDNFGLKQPVTLLSQQQFADQFGQIPNWETFKQQYPTAPGYMTISRVGFNAARDQALVYVTWQVDEFTADALFFYLVKDEGKWNLRNYSQIWIAYTTAPVSL